MTKLSYLDAIRQAQDLAMEKDQNTFILGEDVGKKRWRIWCYFGITK